MNKVATYLNEHLAGEVTSAKSVRQRFSTDSSILTMTPELVAFPRSTQDIRKIARFTWQLAEKGHPLSLTMRGFGANVTGAAIGRGIVVDTATYLNDILDIVFKEKLVHVQPGASIAAVEAAIRWQGLTLRGSRHYTARDMSIGGILASDSYGVDGALADSIDRIEVVLANGDTLETGKMSKREVNRKLGLQTLEGEIYRKLTALFEDNEALIEKIGKKATQDNAGYARITDVRGKDGSFDLTPLFIGSQGTLGIISEVVLKADFFSQDSTHLAIVTDSIQTARDIAERIAELQPAELAIYDGALFRAAARFGVRVAMLGSEGQLGAVLYVRLNEINARAQKKSAKKIKKLLTKMDMSAFDSNEYDDDEFVGIASIPSRIVRSVDDSRSVLPVFDGISIPALRREEFEIALRELETRHHIELPVVLNVLANTYDLYPELSIKTVSDKQRLFKLMADMAVVAKRCGGSFVSSGAEGRVKANAAWAALDEDEIALYQEIRAIFDPLKTLNVGVKQKTELRQIVSSLRNDYGQDSLL
ncbi:FAD-binding oxidoreductase [Candidatus Saccharibacteria bacterium TM7i]|nr:FAD-binding oxidoreductase [Candidatus Saccharibacteria bacterium TM7i]